MKAYKNPALLLSNRILMMLQGGGPRTNSELAVMLNNERGSVSGANSMNASRAFVTYQRVKGQSEVIYTITAEGAAHISTMAAQSLLDPPIRYNEAELRLLTRLKTGFRGRDWKEVFNSRGHMYGTINKLIRQGRKIKKVKLGREVSFSLDE